MFYMTICNVYWSFHPFQQRICNFIDEFDVGDDSELLDSDIAQAAFGYDGVTNENPFLQEQYEELIQCLNDVGLDVDVLSGCG